MAEITVPAVFFALTAVVQLGLGFTVIVRRPRVEWAVVLGLLFLFNGALSVNSSLVNLGLSTFTGSLNTGADVVFFLADRASTYLIAYLALAYPRRPRWAANLPWALPSIFLAMMMVAAIFPLVGTSSGASSLGFPLANILTSLVYDLFSIGFLLILVRWSLLVGKTTSPLELLQFRLLAGAFFLRAVHVTFLYSLEAPVGFLVHPAQWGAVVASPLALVSVLRGLADFAGIVVAVVLLLRHRRSAGSELRHTLDFLIVLMACGLALYAIESSTGAFTSVPFAAILTVLPQLDVLVVRPVFVTYAMVRYGLLGPLANPRHLVRLLVVAFALLGLVPGLYAQFIALGVSVPIALLGGTAIAAAMAALLAILATPYIVPRRVGEEASAAVQTYVGLLEDAYRNGDIDVRQRSALETERVRLGISQAQAEALAEAVRTQWANRAGRDWVAGDRIRGRYQVRERLGRGGFGDVHLAHDALDDCDVVLKRTRSLDPESRRLLLEEALTLRRLDHPNVVRLLRTETIGEEPILVMERMPGGSLATRLAEGRLKEAAVARLAREVASGLAALHALGLVHRDIKPGNILFGSDGAAKLADLGLAAPAPPQGLGDATRSLAAPPGSLRYLPPEVVQGHPATRASDIYALAVVLLEAFSGRHPVPDGLRDLATRKRIVEGPPPRLDGVPAAWRPLLGQALQREPAQRPRDAAAFLAAMPRPEPTLKARKPN